jgi:uncharacterized SAM-binding protein YcdF (DUF218 family)
VVVGGAGLTYAHPLLLLFLAIAAWGLAARRRRVAVLGLIGIFFVSWPPAAWVFAQGLERRYSPELPQIGNAEAIVVLAAGVAPAEGGESEPSLKENTYLRCRHGVRIWKKSKGLPVLLCGGTTAEVTTPAAVIMRRMMVGEGIPESQLWTEERSVSTYENALFGAQILRQKGIRRIVLVTEAYHMLRSEHCFRKQGFEVIPAACNFATVDPEVNAILPGGEGIVENEQTLHELFGLGWYSIKGRI